MPGPGRALTGEDWNQAKKVWEATRNVSEVARVLEIYRARAERLLKKGLPKLGLPSIFDLVQEKVEQQTQSAEEIIGAADRKFYMAAYSHLRSKMLKHIQDAKQPPVTTKEIEAVDKLYDLREKIRSEEKADANYLQVPYDDMTPQELRDLAIGARKVKK